MFKSIALSVALLAPVPVAAESFLFMAEEAGCYWCAQWTEEIGPIYPKTSEGRTAPLVRYDLNRDTPEIELARRVSFTPTFILVSNGKEVSRIEGYPGEDFFWGLLGQMITDAGLTTDEAS